MIEVKQLTKRYNNKTVIDNLSFTAQPGLITGFLGPNGAGKSTTMRIIMGLDYANSGTVTVNGKSIAEHDRPLHEVGALLEAKALHNGRTARNHLLTLAATTGIKSSRVDEVIEAVGLRSVANKRAGKFSLGMGQRLGIASALLGNPQTLILDEPVNGLDPDGVRWIRNLLKDYASQGRTVLLSSHLMSEMALTADRIVVIGRGKLLRDQTMDEFIASESSGDVLVRSPQAKQLASALKKNKATIENINNTSIRIKGLPSKDIGTIAANNGFTLYELTPQQASLEEAYMALTESSVVYRSNDGEENTDV